MRGLGLEIVVELATSVKQHYDVTGGGESSLREGWWTLDPNQTFTFEGP